MHGSPIFHDVGVADSNVSSRLHVRRSEWLMDSKHSPATCRTPEVGNGFDQVQHHPEDKNLPIHLANLMSHLENPVVAAIRKSLNETSVL